MSATIIVLNTEDKYKDECLEAAKKQNADIVLTVPDCSRNDGYFFNNGLRNIFKTTETITFITTHDILHENYLTRVLEKLNRWPDLVGAVYTDYVINHNPVYEKSFSRPELTAGYCLPKVFTVKKEVLDKVDVFFDDNLEVLEFWDMWLRISEVCLPYHLPELLYYKYPRYEKVEKEKFEQTKKYILRKTEERMGKTK